MSEGRYSPDGQALGAMLRSPSYRQQALSDILDALEAERWNQTRTVARLGVGWSTFRRWVAEEPELRRAIDRGRR